MKRSDNYANYASLGSFRNKPMELSHTMHNHTLNGRQASLVIAVVAFKQSCTSDALAGPVKPPDCAVAA